MFVLAGANVKWGTSQGNLSFRRQKMDINFDTCLIILDPWWSIIANICFLTIVNIGYFFSVLYHFISQFHTKKLVALEPDRVASWILEDK